MNKQHTYILHFPEMVLYKETPATTTIILSVNSRILTRCHPVVVRRKKKKWLEAFSLSYYPATFVPLHICQQLCPISQCQAGKSAPCHFRNDNLILSQVCNQFVPSAAHHLKTSTKNKDSQSESWGLHAIYKSDHIRAWRWLSDWFVYQEQNCKVKSKDWKPQRRLFGHRDKMSVSTHCKII